MIENKNTYDIIIVGAGPAGLFAANELSKNKLKILVIDEGSSSSKRKCPMGIIGHCTHCKTCGIMSGVGGAGMFSGGILNLRPDIGGDLEAQIGDKEYANRLVEEVDSTYLRYGAPKQIYRPNVDEVEHMKRMAVAAGAKYIDIIQRLIGSDNAPKVIERFENDLKRRGVSFLLNMKVDDLIIKNNRCYGVIVGDKRCKSKKTIIAPGRVGASWIENVIKKYKIAAKFGAIDVGVRIEVPALTMDVVTKINRDPKFHIRTPTYDDFVRTFCTNERGFVVKEEYEDFVATNGHSMKSRVSENTNFALLVRVELTEPVENTTQYGRSIAKLATTIGGGKPLIQRFGDLRRGRRSTVERIEKNDVKNTLRDVTPGDISMALPHRIVMDLIEGLERLNKIVPGVASDSSLIYAPEIKFYAMNVSVGRNFETSVKNLFAAGDGAGLSRDIVNASATGILTARGVLEGS
jgi:uncharacterized FAD-dependent dehydrogenase